MDGIAIVDKDAGWTSHDVVAKARGILRERRIGHSGTLDPDATGVLVLGIGKATRLLRFLTLLPKTYTCRIVLGVETDTLDASGTVVATHDMTDVSAEAVVAAAARLTGDIEQVPPMVSAVKVGGRRLHELARAGLEVERQPRRVHVARFALTPTEDPLVYEAEVECSSGTYVRSLAADLGRMLGGGAHLRDLRRRAVGPYREDEARPLDAIEVLPLPEAVRGLDRCTVEATVAARVAHGAVLTAEELGATGAGPWAVFGEGGALLAVYERHGQGRVKPAVVLAG